jgi:DNA-binding HxlR family transcriptional regulator
VTASLSADMFDEICPSSLVPFRMADKWAPLVLRCLDEAPRRFGELRIPLHRVTPKALTTSLRRLERDGFVTRFVDGAVVRYDLTALGRGLLEQMYAWCAWTEANWDALLDARDPEAADLPRSGVK